MDYANGEMYQRFCDSMREAVAVRFGEDAEIEIHKVMKNNSLELDSLSILLPAQTVTPNFYLQEYYKRYEKGAKIQELAEEIEELYYEARDSERKLDIDLSFENCRERIVFRLVSQKRNKKLQPTIPHISFLDLMINFYVLISKESDGIASIRITNVMMQNWGCSQDELFSLAKENTERLFPVKICSMRALLENFISGEDLCKTTGGALLQENSPYIITNQSGINGAAVILYPDTLNQLSSLLNGDYYLLPSSIHELLAVPVAFSDKEQDLAEMVREVNSSCVLQEEILSDTVYRYWHEEEVIRICA